MISFPVHYFFLAIILVYIPFHIFEEALGDFPESMYQHKWIPERITHGHWMANNIFFYFPTLVTGYLLWTIFPNYLFIGLGILVWGVINTFDHIFYTIKDRKISPGLYTGSLYLLIAINGFYSIRTEANYILLIESIITGMIYFFFPVFCSMTFHKHFKTIFK